MNAYMHMCLCIHVCMHLHVHQDSEIARLKAQVSRFERHGHTSQLSQSSSGAYQGTGAGTAGLIPVLTSTLKEQVGSVGVCTGVTS